MGEKKRGKKATKSAKPAAKKTPPGGPRANEVVATGAASQRIDERIRELGDWRGKTLERVRRLIEKADPEIVEEWKWAKATSPGTPVFSHGGIVCTGETYKSVVKLTFAKGAALRDPAKLFNSSLDGNVRRAIDIHEGDELDEAALTDLVRAAVALNLGQTEKKTASKSRSRKSSKPALLAGGNPQIAKADGDAPVQAYIAAIPGWKRDVARRIDALVARTVPGVRKAVKWNSPFYGVEGEGWFLSLHCFTKYVKVGFFRGAALRPAPPGESKQKDVRYLDIHENDALDEKLVASWIWQASELPGWMA
jgi:hypothetical protein